MIRPFTTLDFTALDYDGTRPLTSPDWIDARRANACLPPLQARRKNAAWFTALSGSVSRSSNPLIAALPRCCSLSSSYTCANHAPIAACIEPLKHLVPSRRIHLPDHPASLGSLHPHRRLSAISLRGSLVDAFKYVGSIPCPEPSRSWPTIQVLFFVPAMWNIHGPGRRTKARAMPARSVLGGSAGARPAARMSEITASAWPAPSSTTSMPFGASSRSASAAMAR